MPTPRARSSQGLSSRRWIQWRSSVALRAMAPPPRARGEPAREARAGGAAEGRDDDAGHGDEPADAHHREARALRERAGRLLRAVELAAHAAAPGEGEAAGEE